jgi:tetratricopeptide (TPR) repeat protein
VTAGYAVLQTFEGWAGVGGRSLPPSALELRRVRRRLAAVPESDPIRRCLSQLVDVIERSGAASGDGALLGIEIGRVLAAYGKLLQYEASWALAHDVYETLVSYAQGIDDEERLLDAMLMVAFSLRMLARFDLAEDAYRRLRDTAAHLENQQHLLLSELGFAKIAIERGNLPAAAEMLDRIIAGAQAEAHVVMRARALMERARVASQMGDHSTALMLGHEALVHSHDPMERDRVLTNIGVTLMELGLWEQSRDANLLLVATAQEASIRWLAEINLMELAYLEGRELVFEHHRRKLAELPLPPYTEAVYHETSALGLRSFGRIPEATLAFEKMLNVAECHSLNEFIIKAEVALQDVARARSELETTLRRRADDQPPAVLNVARAIADMRTRAGL